MDNGKGIHLATGYAMLKKFGYHQQPRPEPSSNTQNDKAFYHTQRWKRLSRMVLRKYPVCEICNNALSSQVDHKDGNNQNNLLSNLQALCASCHSKKTMKDTK